MCDNLLKKFCVGLYEVGNGRETRGSQSEPTIGDFSGIVTEGFTIPENNIYKIILCEIMCLIE